MVKRLFALVVALALVLPMVTSASAGDSSDVPMLLSEQELDGDWLYVTPSLSACRGFSGLEYPSAGGSLPSSVTASANQFLPASADNAISSTRYSGYLKSTFWSMPSDKTHFTSVFRSSLLSIPAGSAITFDVGVHTVVPYLTDTGTILSSRCKLVDTYGSSSNQYFFGYRLMFDDGTSYSVYRPSGLSSASNSFHVSIPSESVEKPVQYIEWVFYSNRNTANFADVGGARNDPFSDFLTTPSLSYKPEQQNSILRGILQAITDFFAFVTTIPSLILDGIRNLFVPSADDLSGIGDSFTNLMETKLGAIWQIGALIIEFFNKLLNAGNQTSITFPGISLSLAGSTFTLASASVQIWPDGFGLVEEAVKMGGTLVFFGAWLLGMQRWYEKFFGGGLGE